jgi:hypothetical protein
VNSGEVEAEITGQACPLRLVARSEDRGYVASGSCSAPPGVPPKISRTTQGRAPFRGTRPWRRLCTKSPFSKFPQNSALHQKSPGGVR